MSGTSANSRKRWEWNDPPGEGLGGKGAVRGFELGVRCSPIVRWDILLAPRGVSAVPVAGEVQATMRRFAAASVSC